jgi:hypothetical protein
MALTDWLPTAGSFLTSIVVAVVTAYLAVHLALKRFYFEKWWERKAEAYSAILEALHHVRNHTDHNLESLKHGVDLSLESDAELTERLPDGMAELRKRWDVGSFVVSEEAVAVMDAFMQELDASTKYTNWDARLTLKMGAVNKCLDAMRKIARKDLKLA